MFLNKNTNSESLVGIVYVVCSQYAIVPLTIVRSSFESAVVQLSPVSRVSLVWLS